MKKLKKIVIFFVFSLAILTATAFATGYGYLIPAVLHNFPEIDDYKVFDNALIKKSTKPEPWKISKTYNKKQLPDAFRKKLVTLKTVSFLVIQNDSIQYEEYWDDYGLKSYSNSFSMAKTYVSVLIGIALKEGKIKSLDQPVADFIPEFKKDARKKITIKDLLTMSSGLNWDESYLNPFSVTTRAYYGDNLKQTCLMLRSIEEPGEKFEYKSGDTQILSFVLEKATGKTVPEYFEEKLWQATGSENDALWSLDKKKGSVKAYCCINSNARDFARLGKLYLQKGNWDGQQIVDSAYVKASLTPTSMPNGEEEGGKPVNFYGYSWWLLPNYKGEKIFYARGILGQYIYVIPSKNIIAVRLGKEKGEKVNHHYQETYDTIDYLLANY